MSHRNMLQHNTGKDETPQMVSQSFDNDDTLPQFAWQRQELSDGEEYSNKKRHKGRLTQNDPTNSFYEPVQKED